MIERHYFNDRLLKSFEFDFGFCPPNTHNTMEHIYQMPTLSDAQGIFKTLNIEYTYTYDHVITNYISILRFLYFIIK